MTDAFEERSVAYLCRENTTFDGDGLIHGKAVQPHNAPEIAGHEQVAGTIVACTRQQASSCPKGVRNSSREIRRLSLHAWSRLEIRHPKARARHGCSNELDAADARPAKRVSVPTSAFPQGIGEHPTQSLASPDGPPHVHLPSGTQDTPQFAQEMLAVGLMQNLAIKPNPVK